MKIQTITGETQLSNLQVNQGVSHLIIHTNSAITTEEITVGVNRGGENEILISAMPILVLAEYNANHEGYMVHKATEGKYVVPLALDGNVPLDERDYIEIRLKGLKEPATYDIYGWQDGVVAQSVLKYTQQTIQSPMTQRRLKVHDVEDIIIPAGDVFEEMNVRFKNGNSVRKEEAELQQMMIDDNDIVSIEESAVVYGYKDNYIFDVEGILDVEVVTDGSDYVFYTVSQIRI